MGGKREEEGPKEGEEQRVKNNRREFRGKVKRERGTILGKTGGKKDKMSGRVTIEHARE